MDLAITSRNSNSKIESAKKYGLKLYHGHLALFNISPSIKHLAHQDVQENNKTELGKCLACRSPL